MTIALPAEAVRRPGIDLSWPILIGFAAILFLLIVLPMSWLVYFSVTDRSGALTLENFRKLVTDPVFQKLGTPATGMALGVLMALMRARTMTRIVASAKG